MCILYLCTYTHTLNRCMYTSISDYFLSIIKNKNTRNLKVCYSTYDVDIGLLALFIIYLPFFFLSNANTYQCKHFYHYVFMYIIIYY